VGRLHKLFGGEATSYVAVGIVTAILYFGAFYILISQLNFHYRIGMTVAYALAVMFHFFGNRVVTFSTSIDRIGPQSLRYMSMLFVNYLITLGFLSLFVEILSIPSYIAAIFSISTTIVVGFFISKYWVFNPRTPVNHE
jgi:putative flippase GtrA